MPTWYVDGKSEPSFQALDDFTKGYIEAMFWTSAASGVTTEEWQATEEHAEGSIPDDVGFTDLAPEALARIVADCKAFRESLSKDGHGRTPLDLAYDYAPDGYAESNAGHDFWLTRNGSGAGFWDRGLGEAGDTLTKAAERFGECDTYLGDDGKVYLA